MHNPLQHVPGYWMNETSGVLKPAIMAYLTHRPMTDSDIAAMRAYLRQWIDSPVWLGTAIDQMREDVDTLTSRETIHAWLDRALQAGIDPL